MKFIPCGVISKPETFQREHLQHVNYQETLDYLFSRLPMFTRIGSAAFKKDLTNTLALCEVLGNPHKKIRTIHIAGTNGKGSTSHLLASILQEAGYNTGLYTSPHLRDFRERIRINGKMIPEKEVIQFVEKHKDKFEAIAPSFFEWSFALSLDYFASKNVDIAIIETGLGGRLDSTNVITPELSIITNIGWDHMDMLGDTLQKIAAEKAGIIKPGVPVIIGEYQEECMPVFRQKAEENQSHLVTASQVVNVLHFKSSPYKAAFDISFAFGETWKNLLCELPGLYQQKNIATVIAAALQIRDSGLKITEKSIRYGLELVRTNTGLSGRWQVLSLNPMVVCDTGHNKEGIIGVIEMIRMQTYQKLHMVIGMVKDKDVDSVLSLFPADAEYYFTKASIPRALDESELRNKAYTKGLKGSTFATVEEAVTAAKNKASEKDLIFIGGSTFVVAEVV